jgi:hypothetical protein
MEKRLVAFARSVVALVQTCKNGTADGEDVKRNFLGKHALPGRGLSTDCPTGLSNASEELDALPWQTQHAWSIVLEVRSTGISPRCR